MSVELWVERYRPKTLDEFVWQDESQRAKIEEWLAEGALPHVLFSGTPGTGKTSLAKLLLLLLNIPKADILDLNANKDARKIDDFQSRVGSFVSTWAFGPSGIKYVLLDEVDRMSAHAQDLLRGEMERYADICRFVMTCNNPQRLTPAMHSRVQSFQFKTMDRTDFTVRLGEILATEDVSFEMGTLDTIVGQTYPDLRKAINTAQQNVLAGVLHEPSEDVETTSDYLIEMVALVQSGRMLDARKLVVGQAQTEDYPDIFRFLYRNLSLWGETQDQQDSALLAIRKGIVYHSTVADPEINLAAIMCELSMIAQGKC